VITLLGANPATTECGASYTDAGTTASGNCAGSLTDSIVVTSPVNANVPGAYTVRYNVSDGNSIGAAEVTRVVTVTDTRKPVITLNGSAEVVLNCGQEYTDAGAMANDACSGGLTGSIVTSGLPPAGPLGSGNWTVTYNVADGSDNAATASRTVTVLDNCTLAAIAVGDTLLDVTLGGRVQLSVSVTGNVGPVTCQWYKQGAPQGGKAFDIIPGATTNTLVIDPVLPDSEGLYMCTVSDAVTTVNSPVFTLMSPGERVPAAGLASLAMIAATVGLGGISTLKRRARQRQRITSYGQTRED
jgi:hypothetical protein